MCTRKREGGLGFRNFEIFNQALLAKQLWRIITVRESLCARVLKARYFEEMDIMSAPCPQGCSYTWRSLMHGRELLAHGLIWRVGDGTKINLQHDHWIPRTGSMVPLGAVFVHGIIKVAHLLNNQGTGWDQTKIQQALTDDDVTDVQQIVVGGPGKEDFRACGIIQRMGVSLYGRHTTSVFRQGRRARHWPQAPILWLTTEVGLHFGRQMHQIRSKFMRGGLSGTD